MSDEEKMVKVVWTWQRPNSQERLENILAVAFEAALSVDPDVTEINIRAEPHEHTYTNGQWRDEIPHVTMSIRNEQQIINGVFQTYHANTDKTKPVYRFTYASKKGGPTEITRTDRRTGYPLWNPDKDVEEWTHSKLAEFVERINSS
ncbi:hypothetical protein IWX49DRAFT_423523 [Phyllosticta citricarpa]|uniref:Uncharacterized protein n=1 Tax=Phyllosticta paracitricarpa TaxID=2016321 RepID=A0ABR1N4Y6_9PEZI